MRKIEAIFYRKRITARKGVAIELALVLLVLVFAMCSLLVSVATVQTKRVESESKKLSERLVLDNIGEEFCSVVANGACEEWSVGEEVYRSNIEQNDGIYTLTLVDVFDNEVVLTVSLKKNEADNSYRVIKWDYQ